MCCAGKKASHCKNTLGLVHCVPYRRASRDVSTTGQLPRPWPTLILYLSALPAASAHTKTGGICLLFVDALHRHLARDTHVTWAEPLAEELHTHLAWVRQLFLLFFDRLIVSGLTGVHFLIGSADGKGCSLPHRTRRAKVGHGYPPPPPHQQPPPQLLSPVDLVVLFSCYRNNENCDLFKTGFLQIYSWVHSIREYVHRSI